MDRRLELHTILEDVLGSEHVYFQPPATKKMQYPCIVYERSTSRDLYADNRNYHHTMGYSVTYIDRKPDNTVCDRLAALPMSRYERHYTAENLHHDRFVIFY